MAARNRFYMNNYTHTHIDIDKDVKENFTSQYVLLLYMIDVDVFYSISVFKILLGIQ